MSEPSLPELEASGTGCTRSSARSGTSGGGGERELAQVREAELRVRGAGSSRSRPAVPVDQDGGAGQRTRGRQLAAGGGGEGATGAGEPTQEFASTGRADRGGERGDLRGQAGGRRADAPSGAGGRKRGLCDALAGEKAAEIGRLAAEAARDAGLRRRRLEAAEAVLRAGLLKLGGDVLGELLSADPGYRGPSVRCGNGHEAEFAGYREKVIDTVLGPVTLTAGLVPLRAAAGTASPPGTPSSGSPGRRCRRGWGR